MKFPYEPYIIRRLAEGRIFFVNAKMPFEFFLDCFSYNRDGLESVSTVFGNAWLSA